MVDTTFLDQQTVVAASWLNPVDQHVYQGYDPTCGVSTGAANTYILTLPAVAAGSVGYSAARLGDTFTFRAHQTNTGAATLSIHGASPVTGALVAGTGGGLLGGEVSSGDMIFVKWNGAAWELVAVMQYKYPATGSVWRTVPSKLNEIISVKDFGATGNGTTDDSDAIIAAIAAGGESSSVFFPQGTYKVTKPIPLPYSYMRLYGVGGALGSVIHDTAGAGNIFQHAGLVFMEFDHLSFKGTGNSAIRQTDLTAYMIGAHIHDCHFYADLTECLYGNFIFTVIEDNTFGYFGPGASVQRHIFSQSAGGNNSNFNHIRRNIFNNAKGGTEAIFWENGMLLNFEENDFESNSVPSLHIRGAYGLHIINNWFENNNTTYEIVLEDTVSTGNYTTRVERNWFDPHASVTHLFNIGGVVDLYFDYNTGTGMSGKYITSYGGNDNGILSYFGNFLFGYTRTIYDITVFAGDAFSARVGTTITNVTGDGTAYTVIFDGEQVDNKSSYDATTGIFTAANTGMYNFVIGVTIEGLLAGHTSATLDLVASSGGTYRTTINPFAISVGGVATITLSQAVHLTLGDAVSAVLKVSGGTKVVDVSGTNVTIIPTYFSGFRIPTA